MDFSARRQSETYTKAYPFRGWADGFYPAWQPSSRLAA